jgi:hypothetical protein
MVSITISVPEDIKKLMKDSPEINWSGLVRKTIMDKAKELSLKKEIFSQLKNEKDFNDWAVELIRKGRKK